MYVKKKIKWPEKTSTVKFILVYVVITCRFVAISSDESYLIGHGRRLVDLCVTFPGDSLFPLVQL